jgi:hypothetical protein
MNWITSCSGKRSLLIVVASLDVTVFLQVKQHHQTCSGCRAKGGKVENKPRCPDRDHDSLKAGGAGQLPENTRAAVPGQPERHRANLASLFLRSPGHLGKPLTGLNRRAPRQKKDLTPRPPVVPDRDAEFLVYGNKQVYYQRNLSNY